MVSKAGGSADLSAIVPICYHCGVRKLNLVLCEYWGVKACNTCIESLHVPEHKSCYKKAGEKQQLSHSTQEVRTTFRLMLTAYGGRPIAIECKPGVAIRMEDHWAGTYVFFGASMMLVLEERIEINASIIEGLKSLIL